MSSWKQAFEKKSNSFSSICMRLTLGESVDNKSILENERTIIQMNNDAGELLRKFLFERANVKVLGSIPDQLYSFADNLLWNEETEESVFSGNNISHQFALKIQTVLNALPHQLSSLDKIKFLYSSLFQIELEKLNFLPKEKHEYLRYLKEDLEKIINANLNEKNFFGKKANCFHKWFQKYNLENQQALIMAKRSANPSPEAITEEIRKKHF